MYGNNSYGSEDEFVKKHNRPKERVMANGDGNGSGKVYDVFLKMMQPAIVIALAVVGWGLSDMKTAISLNADILRRVEGTQIRVTETVKRLEEELKMHEMSASVESSKRSSYHHTEIRSCLQCKTRPDYHPPFMPKFQVPAK